jgi:hypothetical protein
VNEKRQRQHAPRIKVGRSFPVAASGERLDAHRKRQQAAHPGLTLTKSYNVLEKFSAGEPIEGRDREVYDNGLIGILRQIHDDVDTQLARAYGWPDLPDDEILRRLVALNRERAAEEAGHVRRLRPEFQNPDGRIATPAAAAAAELDLGETAAATAAKPDWPRALPEQMAAVREALQAAGEAGPAEIARRFRRARVDTVRPLLETLAALGHARSTPDGRYAA